MKFRSSVVALATLTLVAGPAALLAPTAAAAPVSPAPSSTDVQHALALRAEFGLSTDRGRVAAAATDSETSSEELGIPLTRAETAELERRDAVALRAGELEARLAAKASQSFAGLWVDQRAGGLVRIGVVKGSDPAAVRSMTAAAMGSDATQLSVERFASSRLEKTQATIARSMMEKQGVGPYVDQASVDVRNNVVRVHLLPDAPSWLVRSLERTYPEVSVDTTASTWIAQSRDRHTGPLYGGSWMSTPTRNCTIGYSNARVGTTRVTLTAGHCPTGPWYQGKNTGGDFLGGTTRSGFTAGGSSTCDCKAVATIPAAKATSSVLTSNTATYYYSRTATSGNYTVGTRLCVSGAEYGDVHNGAIACGQIQDGSATISYSDGPFTLNDAVVTSIAGTYAGDSGGPYGSGRTFMGLHAAGRVAFGMVIATALSKSSRIGGIGVSLRY